jgi:hypothetical protein
VFDAVEKALDEIAGAEAGSTGAAAN